MTWLHSRVSAGLDPARATAWQLSYARTGDGGAVLSLVAAHAIADGAALLDALRRAAADEPPLRIPDRASVLRTLLSDVADGARQSRIVAKWLAGRPRLPRAGKKPQGKPAPGEPAPHPDWTMPHVVVECDSTELAHAAEHHGGSVNTLFAAALARIARAAADREDAPEPDKVALPVSGRLGADDLRANSTKIAMAVFGSEALRKRELAPLKAACKKAYVALAAAPAPPIPLALIQMLPDRVLDRLPQPPAASVLASNLGEPPPAFRELGGVTAKSVSATAHYPGIDAAEVATIGRGVAGWLMITGERATVSVCGLDPGGIPGQARLLELIVGELAEWGVGARPW
ncbi:hypothetical protein FPZ12_012335 [Amycolatopsis acidicola]|uniref:Diacylglycerol O-acyltransferase n=1 Tax=Amycolatopsis acidicola TaxID=2596893 RepID=A0A5N0V7L6_9PSEU|nr:hypothetical protein [Amycolatopsis acidicola]KAA9162025.1 hypothetical protein FPZ12_012335 [Amycolatopsis acidicola]